MPAHLLLGCGGDYLCAGDGEESTVAAKLSVLTFSSHSVGRERPAISQEVNRWRRSSEEEVTIRESRDGQCVHSEHSMK